MNNSMDDEKKAESRNNSIEADVQGFLLTFN